MINFIMSLTIALLSIFATGQSFSQEEAGGVSIAGEGGFLRRSSVEMTAGEIEKDYKAGAMAALQLLIQNGFPKIKGIDIAQVMDTVFQVNLIVTDELPLVDTLQSSRLEGSQSKTVPVGGERDGVSFEDSRTTIISTANWGRADLFAKINFAIHEALLVMKIKDLPDGPEKPGQYQKSTTITNKFKELFKQSAQIRNEHAYLYDTFFQNLVSIETSSGFSLERKSVERHRTLPRSKEALRSLEKDFSLEKISLSPYNYEVEIDFSKVHSICPQLSGEYLNHYNPEKAQKRLVLLQDGCFQIRILSFWKTSSGEWRQFTSALSMISFESLNIDSRGDDVSVPLMSSMNFLDGKSRENPMYKMEGQDVINKSYWLGRKIIHEEIVTTSGGKILFKTTLTPRDERLQFTTRVFMDYMLGSFDSYYYPVRHDEKSDEIPQELLNLKPFNKDTDPYLLWAKRRARESEKKGLCFAQASSYDNESSFFYQAKIFVGKDTAYGFFNFGDCDLERLVTKNLKACNKKFDQCLTIAENEDVGVTKIPVALKTTCTSVVYGIKRVARKNCSNANILPLSGLYDYVDRNLLPKSNFLFAQKRNFEKGARPSITRYSEGAPSDEKTKALFLEITEFLNF